jgi:outer membrane protein
MLVSKQPKEFLSLTKNYVSIPVLVLCATMLAQAQTGTPQKIGIINIQQAIISTKDGQKAASDLQAKYAPKKAELEKKQNDITQLQDQLRKGSNTMSEDAKEKLMRDIDEATKSLNRDREDDQAALDQDQNKLLQQLGQRMMQILIKYGHDNGYALILDVSSAQTPVLFSANGSDITQDIIALYDKGAGAATTSSAAPKAPAAAAKPASPAAKR